MRDGPRRDSSAARCISPIANQRESAMDWITDDVAIGDLDEAQDLDLLEGDGFGSVLGLIPTLRGRKPSELGLRAIRIVALADTRRNKPAALRRAVDALDQLVES